MATPPREDAARAGLHAVLFDLHNTTMDGNYATVGLAHVGATMADRWGVDPASVGPEFMRGLRAVMPAYIDRDFYLMRDVFVEAFRHAVEALGIDASGDDLIAMDAEMWRANIAAAQPVDGAIETMDALRSRGVRVGIVSFADTEVFDALMRQLGFEQHVDVAVCSEAAQSCKPHPGIFRHALDALEVDATRAMFVGDSIDSDIVGGNRLGMVTALVAGTEYTTDVDAFGDDPMTVPDHRISSLSEVVELVAATR